MVVPILIEAGMAALETAVVVAAAKTVESGVKAYGPDILNAMGNTSTYMNPAVNAATSTSSPGELTFPRLFFNPDGAKGKPDHQEKVKELEKKAQGEAQEGEVVESQTRIGNENSRRIPDVQIKRPDGTTRKAFEAERKPNSKRNKLREEEYKRLGIEFETHPVVPPSTPPAPANTSGTAVQVNN